MTKIEQASRCNPKKASLKIQHKNEQDGRIRDRIKAILLYGKGWTSQQIPEALLISDLGSEGIRATSRLLVNFRLRKLGWKKLQSNEDSSDALESTEATEARLFLSFISLYH